MGDKSRNTPKVLKFVVIILLISQVSSVDDDDETFTADELLNIFKLLRNTGNDQLASAKISEDAKHVVETTKQFLVVAVMSQEELVISKEWQAIPNNVNNRLNVYFNKKLRDCDKQVGKKPMHGEVLCLYYENRLEEMISTLKKENEEVKPFVVMYSVYIPCALISGIEYSCAEELGMEALVNYGQFKMIVGFDELFDNTDSDAAKEMLCQGGIDVYQLTNNDQISLYQIGIQPEEQMIVLFQDQFLKALKEAPIGVCIEDCQHSPLTEDFLACYVDAVTYYSTQKNKNLEGPLTELKRQAFLDRAKKFISTNTESSCGMHGDVTKYWLEFCVIQGLQSSTTIGAQKKHETDDTDRWMLPTFGSKWGILYHFDPAIRFPKAYCAKNVIGFCKDVVKSGRFADRNFVRLGDKAKTETRRRKPK